MQQRPPEPACQLDHAAIAQELAEIAAHGGRDVLAQRTTTAQDGTAVTVSAQHLRRVEREAAEVSDTARRATLGIARANRLPGAEPVVLAPGENHGRKSWKSAYVTDPWDIPLEQKADLLLRANAEALKVPSASTVA